MKNNKSLKAWVATLIIIISFIGSIYYTKEVILWKIHVNNNNRIKSDTSSKVKIVKDNKKIEYNIDFKSLKEKNEDILAYIKLNNTKIDYLVVQSNNNDYYLNHNLEKKWNTAGWIFIDYRNKLDETDKNIILYGHNMKDGSMFGSLKNVLDESWYKNKENQIVLFVTPKATYRYQIFSSYTIEPETNYLKTDFENEKDYESFLNTLKSRSVYDYNVSLSKDDKIITLSSCNSTGKKRVVLHAKLLD